jgi:hypothetical protein
MARNAMTADDKEALADAAGAAILTMSPVSVCITVRSDETVSFRRRVTMSKIQRRTMPRAMVAAVTGTDVTPLSSQAAYATFTPPARGRRYQKYMRPMKEAGFSADKLFWATLPYSKVVICSQDRMRIHVPPMTVNGSSLPAMPLRTVRVQ